MNSLSDIKRRLISVKQTRQITGAMETISIAKMQKALARFDSYGIYADAVEQAVISMLSCGDELTAHYTSTARGGKLYIVIASDKGLCGGFNHDVFKLADSVIERDCTVIPIGQTAADHYSSAKNVDMRFVSLGYSPDYAKVMPLAETVIDGFGNDFGSVALIYTKLISHTAWKPVIKTVLPVSSDMRSNVGAGSATVAEPSANEVLKTLLPLYISSACYGALLGSSAAEHSARRVAMSSSTKSADEMIETLSIEYNRARQNTVTEQITEIIGSMSALGAAGERR